VNSLIPVHLHIPKNAGTYVQDVFSRYFIRTLEREKEKEFFRVQKISVESPLFNLTLTVEFLTDYWKNDENMKAHPVAVMRGNNNPRAKSCGVETFKTYLRNKQLRLLAVVIEPVGNQDVRSGLFQAYELLDICGKTPLNFLILRDAFSRQQSLYYYLTGEESSHEPTHGSIKQESFLDYIKSEKVEDSWLIRVTSGMRTEESISRDWFNLTTNFLDFHDFEIGFIKDTDALINKVLFNCFNKEVIKLDREQALKNASGKSTKITIDSLDEETKQKFLEKTHWDTKLRERYCKKND
jgi:hypothetical protein